MVKKRLPVRRRIRLDPLVYADPGLICSVTVAVRNRTPVFSAARVAAAAVDALREHAARAGVPIYAYCFMPDHVHLVLSPSPECDVVRFVGEFKNLVQRAAWKVGVAGGFWQGSFWDHFLRSDEQLERVVEYVLDNPVRQGIVAHRGEFPFSGSFVFTL